LSEDILGVAYRAYEALTGQEFTVEVAGMRPWPLPLGQDWDFDDAAEMRRRYPRLGDLRLGGGFLDVVLTPTTLGCFDAGVRRAGWYSRRVRHRPNAAGCRVPACWVPQPSLDGSPQG
jgi:hypothetical protein